MKKIVDKIKVFFAIICLVLFNSGCEDYLAKTDLASIPESDVFGTFKSFQGFESNMYNYIFSNCNLGLNNGITWSSYEEVVSDATYLTENQWEIGSYKIDNTNNAQNPLRPTGTVGITSTVAIERRSMWDMPWFCIRLANISLAKLPLLKVATQSERDVLKGQAYFFRGFSHFELIKVWGGLPYIDKFLQPNDDMHFGRLSYNECTEKIVADLDSAIHYLPVNWDSIPAGASSIGLNTNLITKGAAMGIKTKVLLYAASPLMNGTQTGNYSYNTEYSKRAADAAWQVIQLANQGVYQLLPWSNYSDIFFKTDATYPGQIAGYKELIFQDPEPFASRTNDYLKLYSLISIGVYAGYDSPTANMVDRFESIDGKPISKLSETTYPSGFDPTVSVGRDPRMTKAILTDGEVVIQNPVHAGRTEVTAQLYTVPVLGADRNGNGQTAGYSRTGYGIKKFTPIRWNRFDDASGSAAMKKFNFIQPQLRLAEIYLFFAEAANEAYGPTTTVPGTNLTAEQAVNIVRNRAGMVNVRSEFTASKDLFRERIRNERSVELCFEGHRWYDVRRWHIASLDMYKSQWGVNFDKAHTFFILNNVKPIIFNERDYWLPLPTDQVTMYGAFYQNPGW